MRQAAGTHRRAFTMLEMLLALGLLGVLVGSITSFLFGLTDRRAALLRAAEDLHAGNAIIETLEEDLMCSVAGGGGAGAGVKGSKHQLRVLSRAAWIEIGGRANADPWTETAGRDENGDELAGVARLVQAGGDRVASEIRFNAASKRVTIGRSGSWGSVGASEDLTGRIEYLKFRYHNGRSWVESFDSAAEGKLPSAVEVLIWFAPLGVADAASVVADNGLDTGEFAHEATEPDDAIDAGEADEAGDAPSRAPDRRRVIAVPDARDAAWGGGA